jgi:hypothetical protein
VISVRAIPIRPWNDAWENSSAFIELMTDVSFDYIAVGADARFQPHHGTAWKSCAPLFVTEQQAGATAKSPVLIAVGCLKSLSN